MQNSIHFRPPSDSRRYPTDPHLQTREMRMRTRTPSQTRRERSRTQTAATTSIPTRHRVAYASNKPNNLASFKFNRLGGNGFLNTCAASKKVTLRLQENNTDRLVVQRVAADRGLTPGASYGRQRGEHEYIDIALEPAVRLDRLRLFPVRQEAAAAVPLVCGVVLMIFPYFVSATLPLVACGVALTAVPYFVRL